MYLKVLYLGPYCFHITRTIFCIFWTLLPGISHHICAYYNQWYVFLSFSPGLWVTLLQLLILRNFFHVVIVHVAQYFVILCLEMCCKHFLMLSLILKMSLMIWNTEVHAKVKKTKKKHKKFVSQHCKNSLLLPYFVLLAKLYLIKLSSNHNRDIKTMKIWSDTCCSLECSRHCFRPSGGRQLCWSRGYSDLLDCQCLQGEE